MECPNCGRQISVHSQRCRWCGKTVPPGQYLLEETGMVPPSAPPACAATGARPEWRAASLGDRLIAAIIDSIVVLGASAVVSVWCFLRWGVTSGPELQLTTASLLLAGALSALLGFAYLWFLEAGLGATLGKVMVGVRVVRTGSRSPLLASALRNALRIIDGIGFYFVGATVAQCSRLHRRLGDIVAGTVVVEERFSGGLQLLAVVLWTALLAGSVWALPRVCTGEFPTQPPRYFGRTVVQLSYDADSASVRIARLRIAVQLAPASREGVASVESPSH